MGAVEHLRTLCCLGLPPESAMVREITLGGLNGAAFGAITQSSSASGSG